MNRKLKKLCRHRNGIVRRLWERETPEDQAALERVDAEIDAIEDRLYALPRARHQLLAALRFRVVEVGVRAYRIRWAERVISSAGG